MSVTGPSEASDFVLSFPKAGRTWLRFILGQVMVGHFGLESVATLDDTIQVTRLSALSPLVPRIAFLHEGKPDFRKPGELPQKKESFHGARVLLLARDPRDIAISHYYERRHRFDMWAEMYRSDPTLEPVRDRLTRYSGTLSEFLREEVGSLRTIVEYYNIWAARRDVPRAFAMLRYEDLHLDPIGSVRSALALFGLEAVPESLIASSVDRSSFDKMQALERSGGVSSKMLRPGDLDEPDSFKVRKGRMDGHRTSLSAADARYASGMIERLSPIYGYSP